MMMSLDIKAMEKLVLDRIEIQKKLEDIGFEIIGFKDINKDIIIMIREIRKSKKNYLKKNL